MHTSTHLCLMASLQNSEGKLVPKRPTVLDCNAGRYVRGCACTYWTAAEITMVYVSSLEAEAHAELPMTPERANASFGDENEFRLSEA